MKNLKVNLLLVFITGITATACETVIVDPNDDTPPQVSIIVVPDPVYRNGTPYTEPVDINRTIVMQAIRGSSSHPHISAVARDSESGISSVRLTINATNLTCFKTQGRHTSWSSSANWSETLEIPSNTAAPASDMASANIVLSVENFIRHGNCFEFTSGSGEVTSLNRAGIRGIIRGTYSAVACNHSDNPRSVKCSNRSSATGLFRLEGADGIAIDR